MLTRTLALLRFSLLLFITAAASYAQPQIWAGDYQTASVDNLTFALPLQVRTSLCIDMPCTPYSVTFVSPDARLAVFCQASPCIPSTTITVANPANSELATVTLWVGTLAASYLITATTRGVTLYFHETNSAGQPASISATGGSPQTARIGETYSSLTATVTDSYGNPNSGLLVTFTAPLPINRGVSAPTALFNGSSLTATATTNSTGRASSPPLVANLTGGPFTVTATLSGLSTPATFSLTNLVPVTIQTNPTGRSFTVDGVSYTTTQVFSWTPGSTHTLATTSPQSGPTGTQYVWASWSDAGAISHTITAAAGAVFTAAFHTQYLLTTSASPSTGGTVAQLTGFYNSGQSVALSATANSGFTFTNWTGSGTGAYSGTNPAGTVTMNGPISETATFTSSGSVTIQTNPTGRSFSVDGVSYTSTQVFSWTPGSTHTIATATPQLGPTGTQYVWTSWSDAGAISHTITAAAGAVFTAAFHTQYLLTTSASPTTGGTVAPLTGYYNSGQSVALSATANSGFTFTNWTGSGTGAYSGTNPAGTVTMNGPISETATFNSSGSVTIQTNPTGRSFTVDGVSYTSTQVFSWTPGSTHTLATTTPQSGPTGTQYVWTAWSDSGPIEHTITATPGAVITASFTTQYLLTTVVSPPTAGSVTVSPPSPTGYYDAGAAIQLTATPNPGLQFLGWRGSLSDTINPYTITLNSPFAVTAMFTGATPTSTGLRFIPLSPCRLLETRAQYNYEGRTGDFGPPSLAAGEIRTLSPPASTLCNIPSTAKAYFVNVTLIPSAAVNYVTVWPAGDVRPNVWTIRSPDGQIVANSSIVRAGLNGAISVYTSDRTDLLLDISGYFTDSTAPNALAYYPLTPCRVIDTRILYRSPAGPFGPPTMAAGEARRFRFPAGPYCSIPSAAAYAVTITVVPPGPLAYLTAWPDGSSQPNVSSINSFIGRVLANSVVIPASADGSMAVFVYNTTDFLIDITGYFAADDGQNGLDYFPITQCRAAETTFYPDDTTRTIIVPNSPACSGIPSTAQGYALNVTAMPNGSPMPFLTAYPSGQPRPNASILNAFQGQVVTNAAIIAAGPNGAIDIYAYRATNIVVELSGYFARP